MPGAPVAEQPSLNPIPANTNPLMEPRSSPTPRTLTAPRRSPTPSSISVSLNKPYSSPPKSSLKVPTDYRPYTTTPPRPHLGGELVPALKVDMANLPILISTLVSNVKDLNSRAEESEAQLQALLERKEGLETALHRSNARIQELEATRVDLERKLNGSDSLFKREMRHLEEQFNLLNDKVEDSMGRVHNLHLQTGEIKMRSEFNELNTRVDLLANDGKKIQQHLDSFAESVLHTLTSQIEQKSQEMINSNFSQIGETIEKHVKDKMESFARQQSSLMQDLRADIQLVDHQIRETFAYNLDLSQQQQRREMAELGARVETSQNLLSDCLEFKRQVADIEGSIETITRRMETLNSEMLQRHTAQSGVKGRIEMIENMVHENRQSIAQALDEIRNDLECRTMDSDTQRLLVRVESYINDCKNVKASSARLETQVQDLRQLFTMVGDLNERITMTYGDIESTGLAVSGELGEVKGKLENIQAREQALELRMQETSRSVQHQIDEMALSIAGRMEQLIGTQQLAFESKVAQRLDPLLSESKQLRSDTRQQLHFLEEKLERHEQSLSMLHNHIEGSLSERCNQNQVDLRELARRVDLAVTDRKDTAQMMRGELSQVQEIIHGLQQQYENLLSDAAQRNEAWADMSRDLRTRMEQVETAMNSWRTSLDTVLDDMRHQASQYVTDGCAQLSSALDALVIDHNHTKSFLHSLEDDAQVTAKALADFDEQFSHDLSALKETVGTSQMEISQMNTRLDVLDDRMDQDSARMAKAVLDLDEQVNSVVKDAKATSSDLQGIIEETQNKVEGLYARLPSLESRIMETVKSSNQLLTADLNDLQQKLQNQQNHHNDIVAGAHDELRGIREKIPQIEIRLTELLRSNNNTLANEIGEMKRAMSSFSLQSDLDTVQDETRATILGYKELRSQVERLEFVSRAMSGALDEMKVQIGEVHFSQLEELKGKLDTSVEELRASKSNQTRNDAQVQQLARVCKELADATERIQQQVTDISVSTSELSSSMNQSLPKLESIRKIETNFTTLSKSCKDLTESQERVQQSLREVQTAYVEISTNLSNHTSKTDPSIKRLETTVQQLQRSHKDFLMNEEKMQISINELQNISTETATGLNQTIAKVEALTARPFATESSLKDLKQTMEAMNSQLRSDAERSQEMLVDQYTTLASGSQQQWRTLQTSTRDLKTRLEGLELVVGDQQGTLQRGLEDIRAAGDAVTESLTRRLETACSDIKALKAATQKADVQLNDMRTFTRVMTELNEQVNSSLNELRASQSGIGTDIMGMKGKVEKQVQQISALETRSDELEEHTTRHLNEIKVGLAEIVQGELRELRGDVGELKRVQVTGESRTADQERQLKQEISKDILALNAKMEEKFQKWDDKLYEQVEELTGRHEKLHALCKAIQMVVDEHKKGDPHHLAEKVEELSGQVNLVIQKQELVDQLNQFGVKLCTELKEQLEQFEAEQTRINEAQRITIDKEIQRKLTDYDKKLQVIIDREKVANDMKDFGVKFVQDLQRQFTEVRREVEGEVNGLMCMFDLTKEEVSMSGELGPDQCVNLLMRKPAFAGLLRKIREELRLSGLTSQSLVQAPLPLSDKLKSREKSGSVDRSSVGSGNSTGSQRPAVGLDIEDAKDGVRIVSIRDGGPGDYAGMMLGDIIVALNGVPLRSRVDYKKTIKLHKPGDVVAHTIHRVGIPEAISVDLTLGESPNTASPSGSRRSSLVRSRTDSTGSPF